MDRLVKRVTVIRQSGDKREATTIYREPRDDDDQKSDSLIRRVTVLQPKGDGAVVVRKLEPKGPPKLSRWSRPLERATRRLLKAQIIFAEEMLRRRDKANRRERDGWLREAPSIVAESSRRAYNEARKAVPFKILPKAKS
jgi:hypothetical protein